MEGAALQLKWSGDLCASLYAALQGSNEDSPQFSVTLVKDRPDGKCGWRLDATDAKVLHVCEVEPSGKLPVATCNATVPDAKRGRTGVFRVRGPAEWQPPRGEI